MQDEARIPTRDLREATLYPTPPAARVAPTYSKSPLQQIANGITITVYVAVAAVLICVVLWLINTVGVLIALLVVLSFLVKL